MSTSTVQRACFELNSTQPSSCCGCAVAVQRGQSVFVPLVGTKTDRLRQSSPSAQHAPFLLLLGTSMSTPHSAERKRNRPAGASVTTKKSKPHTVAAPSPTSVPAAARSSLLDDAAVAAVDEEMRPPSPHGDCAAAAAASTFLLLAPSPPPRSPSPPQRTPSQRDRKPTIKLAESTAAAAANNSTLLPLSDGLQPLVLAAGAVGELPPLRGDLAVLHTAAADLFDFPSPSTFQPGPTGVSPRHSRGAGLKVPRSHERWIVVGVWLASRDLPMLPFWLPLVDKDTGHRLPLDVPYKSMMAALTPIHMRSREGILLHVRVVQRTDEQGQLFGEVRYLCTDIAVSYEMGNNAFKWIGFQSVHRHATRRCVHRLRCVAPLLICDVCCARSARSSPTIFQVCCSTWNTSLNRQELRAHLALASTKGGMVFQSPDAEVTRAFLRTILHGRGLTAKCTVVMSLQQQVGMQQITTAAASLVVAPPASSSPAAAEAVLRGADSSSSLQHAFVSLTDALVESEPLWFHPVELEAAEIAATVQRFQMPGIGEMFAHLSAQTGPAAAWAIIHAHAAAALTLPHGTAASPAASAKPVHSCSKKKRHANDASSPADASPLHEDLWPFIQFHTVATDSVPSVRICNGATSAAAAKYVQRAAVASETAALTSALMPVAIEVAAANTAAVQEPEESNNDGDSQSGSEEDEEGEHTSVESQETEPVQLSSMAVLGAAAAASVTGTADDPVPFPVCNCMTAQERELFQEFKTQRELFQEFKRQREAAKKPHDAELQA